MKKLLPALLVVGLLATGPSGVSASSLISGGDPVFGPDSITIDTATGFEWLDWTLSSDRSYDYVVTQFGVGGEFEGWRHASVEEVYQLFVDASIPYIDGTYHAENFSTVSALLDLLTITNPSTNYQWTNAFTNTDYSPGNKSIASTSVKILESTGTANENSFGMTQSVHSTTVGHALVRVTQSSIPEPSALALLAVGLLGISGFAFRNRQ